MCFLINKRVKIQNKQSTSSIYHQPTTCVRKNLLSTQSNMYIDRVRERLRLVCWFLVDSAVPVPPSVSYQGDTVVSARVKQGFLVTTLTTSLTRLWLDTLLNVFLAIAVDNLANAQELTKVIKKRITIKIWLKEPAWSYLVLFLLHSLSTPPCLVLLITLILFNY